MIDRVKHEPINEKFMANKSCFVKSKSSCWSCEMTDGFYLIQSITSKKDINQIGFLGKSPFLYKKYVNEVKKNINHNISDYWY